METLNRSTLNQIDEKEISPISGGLMLFILIVEILVSTALMVFGIIFLSTYSYLLGGILLGVSCIGLTLFCFLIPGLRILNPNEALVLTFFGQYYGTIKKHGFFYVNPFAVGFNPSAKPVNQATEQIVSAVVTKPTI